MSQTTGIANHLSISGDYALGKPAAQSSPREQSNADWVAQSSGFEPSKSDADAGTASKEKLNKTRFRMFFMECLYLIV